MPATKKAVSKKVLDRFRTPKCRECGSSDLTATSSTQYRVISGRKRQVADVVCNSCGHTWWSVNPKLRAQARQLDAERKSAELKSGKKVSVRSGTTSLGRNRVTKRPRVSRELKRQLDVTGPVTPGVEPQPLNLALDLREPDRLTYGRTRLEVTDE